MGINMAEIIPYRNFKEKIEIVRCEEGKGRYVEVWNKLIYSAVKWRCWK